MSLPEAECGGGKLKGTWGSPEMCVCCCGRGWEVVTEGDIRHMHEKSSISEAQTSPL